MDLNNCKKGKLEDDNAIGIFHICFEDFIKYFSSVTICLVNSKFHKETISAKLNYDDCILDAFDLFVTKKKEFYISIFQVVEHRNEYLRRDLIFYVLKMTASNTIESMKRQLQNMKTHKEDAFDRAEKADLKVAGLLERREQQDKEKSDTLKRISQLEQIVGELNADLTSKRDKLQSAEKFAVQV